jgi:antitoxin FitA
MASIIIRRLAEETKERLRVRAALHGRSMEEEARQILVAALGEKEPAKPENMYDLFRRHFEPLGGVSVKIPLRGRTIRAPHFEK